MKNKIAFKLMGSGKWIGSLTYLKNTSEIIKNFIPEIGTCLLINQQIAARIDDIEQYTEHFDKIIYYSNWLEAKFPFLYKLKCFFFGNQQIESLLKSQNIKFFFENAEINRFKNIKKIAWIPDFQHYYYPQYFSLPTRISRNFGFLIQSKQAYRVILSSQSAKRDFERIYKGKFSNKLRVVSFSSGFSSLDLENQSCCDVLLNNAITEKFFFVPNQFWPHKEHSLVIEAFEKVFNRKPFLKNKVSLVFTGKPISGHENYYKSVKELSENSPHATVFKFLGNIKYSDVLLLNMHSLAVINPSKFEGWSTIVEEAKTLGTTCILSDLDVNIEQHPSAYFFKQGNAEELSHLIEKVLSSQKQVTSLETIQSNLRLRQQKHAEEFLDVFI